MLSELAHVTCNLYQFTQSDNEKAPLKLVIGSNLDVSKDASGQVFAIIQLRGGDAEAITTVIPGKEKESIKDEMDEETLNSDSLSASPSPAISQGHLKEAENAQEHEDVSTQANYYWQIVSKQVEIATHERFMDSFMYAMCKRVLPENIFISMKNRLTYIIHLRQEEKKNQILDSMVFSSILKDEDHDEDEEYIVRVYSELTGSILIDQLIVEEAHNYLKTVLETSAEKSPFIPISREEFTIQEANNKLSKQSVEDDKTQVDKQEPPTLNIQKSYTFNEDKIKIFIGWQSLSGRSYSRYYLTATVLFFGKYGARLGHIDQYTTRLSLVKLESTNTNPNNTTAPTTENTTNSNNANSSSTTNTTSGMGSPRTSPLLIQSSSSMTLKSPRSGLHKPKPAAIFLKGNRDTGTGNDSDLCAEVDLSRLPKSVHSIIVVVTATSNAQDSGFQELKDPYVKITTNSVGDLYRYQFHTSERAYQSFIACRLTCLRNPNDLSSANLTAPSKNQIGNMYGGSFIGLTKWKISNIGEYSLGVHPLIDPHLKSQVQKHVPTFELPPCMELATQHEIEEQEREKLLQQQQENKTSEEDKTTEKEDFVLMVSNASDLDLTVNDEEPKKEKPKCFRIPKQEVKTVGFDFSTVKNLDSIQVLEFSQHGKLLTGAKPTIVNEANDLKKRKLALSKKSDHPMNIPMSESFTLKEEGEENTAEQLPRQDQMFQSLTSFHRMDLTYSKESHAPYFMCFLLKFKDIITNEDEDALDYSLIPENRINCFRLWNVDEKVDMCFAKLENVFNIDGSEQALEVFNWQQHANLAVIAYRSGQKDEWFIEVLDEIVTFKTPARRYLRSMLQKCQFDISEPSCDIFTVPAPKDTVTKEFHKDRRDLVLGFGIAGSGGQKHLLNAEVEIYDHFGRYLGKVYEGYSDMDAKLKHRPINFLTIYTQDDEEQFDIRMKDLIESTTVKYIVANIEVKSRSILNEKSQVYTRLVDMRSGKELTRVQASGYLFLDKYIPKKTVEKKEDVDADDDSYDSGDESDNEVVVTMCVIEFTKEGWRIIGAGEKNLVDLIPKYISLKPEALKIEIIKGRNLIPVDHGSADPYLRIKLNEKNSRKGAKKQKVRTKLCNRTIHPDWHETHTIQIFDYDDTLIVKCMDYEKTRDQYMGEVRLKVGFLLRLHNQGRDRKFVLRNDEYWKAVEGKLTGMKKEMALASQPMGDLFMRFSIGSLSDVVTKK